MKTQSQEKKGFITVKNVSGEYSGLAIEWKKLIPENCGRGFVHLTFEELRDTLEYEDVDDLRLQSMWNLGVR